MPKHSLTRALRETLELFSEPGEPKTTSEVADRLDLGRRSTYERLDRLVDRDHLGTKKVGANGRVWWRPPNVAPSPPSASRETSGETPGTRAADVRDLERSGGAVRADSEAAGAFGDVGDDDVSFSLDTDGRVATWNLEAEALTGWTASDVLDEPVSTLFAAGFTSERDTGEVLDTARLDGHFLDEGWCERPTRADLPVRVAVTPSRADDEAVSGYRVVLCDETARKLQEDERRLLEQVRGNVLEAGSSRDGVEGLLSAVCEHTEWAYGEAWEPAAEGDHLEYVVGHAAEDGLAPFRDASEYVRFPFGEGLPGEVYESGRTKWLPDVSSTPKRVFHRTDVAAEAGLQAAHAVPITDDEDDVVLVLVFFLRERRPRDERLVGLVNDLVPYLGSLMGRRRSKDELAAEQSLLDQVFETSPIGLLVTDGDGTVIRANRRADDVLGRDEPVVGESFTEIERELVDRNGANPPVDRLPLARALETESDASTEVQLQRDDDETVWVTVSAAPLETTEGATVLLKDVTERRTREHHLQIFRKAVEASGHSMYVTDADGTIQYVNPAFEGTTGYTAAEAIGRTPSILKSGEHDRAFYEDLWETVLAGGTWRNELVNTRKDGERYVVDQTIAPVEDEAGSIEHFVAVNADVTERKDRERRYDAVFNQTYQFTGLTTPDGTVVEANDAALSFAGVDRDQVRGKRLWDTYWFRHDEATDRAREAVERARDGEFVRQQLEIQGADRTSIVDFSVRPVTDDRDEVVYLVPEGRDITDRVEAERQVARQREQLAALNNVNTLIRDITEAVVEKSSRAAIERTVCEGVAAMDAYEFAWIGTVDADSRTVNVRAEAPGTETHDRDSRSVDPRRLREGGPIEKAIRTRSVVVEMDVESATLGDATRDDHDGDESDSIAAVPLLYDDTLYGVLSVSADRPSAFDDHTLTVLGQFGEVVAQAIAATERKRALVSGAVVELSSRIPDVADHLGVETTIRGRISLDDVVATSDDAYLVFGTVSSDGRETLDELAEDYDPCESVTEISEGSDGSRFQARISELPLHEKVAARGGSIEEFSFEDGALQLRIRFPPNVDAGVITETVEDVFPTAEILAKRQFPRREEPVAPPARSLFDDLTDRQQAVLEAAYHGGYFEWPRDTAGEHVAAALGIAPSTFSQHLRIAERKTFDSVFSSPESVRRSPE